MIFAAIFSASVLICSLGFADASCPTGYVLNGNFCYDFRHGTTNNEGCQSTCANAGAKMLCIQNADQQSFVFNNRGSGQVWIGYFRVGIPFSWAWYSGCVSSYTNWGPAEGSDSSQYFVMMYDGYGGQWADVATDWGPIKCICQTDASPGPTSQPSAQPSTQPIRQPSSHPTSQPSMQPTHLPTSMPSSQPIAQPSSQPSTQPSSQSKQSILSSPTFKFRNGYAFAALTSAGSVEAWGGAEYGGDASAVSNLLTTGVTAIVHARFAFAALRSDGTAAMWGTIADTITGTPIHAIAGQDRSFALATTSTGAVYVRSSCDDAADPAVPVLASGASYVIASAGAFVAVRTDGTAYAWGDPAFGGLIPSDVQLVLSDIEKVVATRGAFAALLASGQVVAWGNAKDGGDTSAVDGVLTDVWHISSSQSTFVAFNNDGSIAVWGHPVAAATSTIAAQLASGVIHVTHTFAASAALKSDGTVVTWGQATSGGDSSAVQAQLQDVAKLYANGKAFAALTTAGQVVVWGKASDGGEIPSDKMSALTSDVLSVYHTDRAFAALKSDGSLIVWGKAGQGGSTTATTAALLTAGVHTVCANDAAFSAIKTNGQVVAWGHPASVRTEGVQFASAALVGSVRCH